MKLYSIIIGILAILFLPNVAYANTIPSYTVEELGENQADYLEIVVLQQQIIDKINVIRKNFQYKQVYEDYQIELTSAKKIYINPSIFSLDTSKTSKVMKKIEDSTYMWLLLVTVGNDTYQVHIAKGLPLNESITEKLTEEATQYIKDKEGKWSISGIEILEGKIVDYEKTINNNLQSIDYDSNAKIVLCGGLEHIFQPAALVMNHDEVELLIPLYDLKIDGTIEEIESIKPMTATIEDEVYLYKGIKAAVNEMENQNDEFISGGITGYIKLQPKQPEDDYDNIIIGLAVVVVLSILFGICFTVKMHK